MLLDSLNKISLRLWSGRSRLLRIRWSKRGRLGCPTESFRFKSLQKRPVGRETIRYLLKFGAVNDAEAAMRLS
jgi:hypothetical protein